MSNSRTLQAFLGAELYAFLLAIDVVLPLIGEMENNFCNLLGFCILDIHDLITCENLVKIG